MTLIKAVEVYNKCNIKTEPEWDASQCSNCPLIQRISEGEFDGWNYCDLLYELEFEIFKEVNNGNV